MMMTVRSEFTASRAARAIVAAAIVTWLAGAGCESEPSAGPMPPPVHPVAATTQRAPGAVPLEWQPSLEGSIVQSEAALQSAMKQQEMNLAASNLAAVLDAKMYFVFERYVASLAATSRAAAIEEQRQFRERRRKDADAAAKEYAGGSMAPLVGSQEFVEATKRRIAELEKRMAEAK